MKLPASIFTVFFVFFSSFVFTQNNFEFDKLSGENISTQSITYAVKQDSIGNIWIASEEGVIKYDSKQIKIYNTYDGLPENLNNRITALFVDSKQRVWIGLENGLCLYDKAFDRFNLIQSEIDINPSLITAIAEDDTGNIWIGGYNGLWKVNNETLKLSKKGNSLNIQTIAFKNDILIYGTLSGLFSYDSKTDVVTEILENQSLKNISFIGNVKDNTYAGLKSGDIYILNTSLTRANKVELAFQIKHPIKDIITDNKSNFYIATDGEGIYYLNKALKLISQFKENVDNPSSISSNGVYDIEFGDENILWIATYSGGINYLDFNKKPFQRFKHFLNTKNSIATDFSRSIAEDKNGNIWFGTTKGISIWNPKNNTWKQIPEITPNKNREDDIVLALEPDNEYMWAGTYNRGLFKINIDNFNATAYTHDTNDIIDLEKIYTVFKDSKNNIWFGGIDGSLTVIRQNNRVDEYPIYQIKHISESKTGHILASGRNGVYKINDDNKEFELIEKLKPNKVNLAYATINAVQETANGNLVLATNGSGLVFYNVKNKSIKKLTIASNLPSDIVQGVLLDDNTVWASTTKGLAQIKITKTDTVINVFDKKDGMASTEFNYGSFAKLKNGKFAFGGRDGVTIFNPKNILESNYKPNIVFDEFKLFNKVITAGKKPLSKHINEVDKIILKAKENSIELGFTGILHSSASKVKYSWKLEGFDENWSEPSTVNFATYTNLAPNNYIFKVRAYNKYATVSDERQIEIKVLPPWWATNQAYALYVILFLLIIVAIVHITSVIVKKKNADQQIDFFNNITHEIKTPLTILISSLDNITENIGTGEESKKRIKTTVMRINSLFEQMLNFQKVTSEGYVLNDISKIDLEAHINKRIYNFGPLTQQSNLQIEFNNNFKEPYFYFDKEVFDKIFLNLLSNAIKYSFENGTITINLDKTSKNELQIEIIDEGLGIPKDQQKYILTRYYRARNVINSQRPGTGLGLMMVKKLLEKTGGSIEFISEENIGTKFTIKLKSLKYEYDKQIQQKESTIGTLEIENEDRSELDAFSDSKILIVEDNDELRQLLVDTLGVYFQVFEAINGKEGLEIASQIFPNIILTDLIMPELDGMQMARQLKDDINLNHIPVFMLTVLQNSAQKIESIETGISEYIEKPIDIKFLLAKIINTLKWQKKLRDKFKHDNDSDNASLFRNKNDQDFLQNLEDKILENIENESFSVHDLSGSFSMSRTSLYMKLKNLVDLSPQDFIIHTKLKYAKKLLIEGDCSIKEVAYRSGFSNPKYFSTSFKKFYKMTPSGFLESLKQE